MEVLGMEEVELQGIPPNVLRDVIAALRLLKSWVERSGRWSWQWWCYIRM
jgi:hypothetical protein